VVEIALGDAQVPVTHRVEKIVLLDAKENVILVVMAIVKTDA